ncbi:MAG: GreA/GreB family elongation factor, partial [Campylobacteraceae bacterium]|nr:GreA/GreB family elongation factor [Campylobacteraceae bacterium]
ELLHEKVNFGSQVTVIDLTTDELKIFIILGTYESNPSENKISNISPVGKQLLGKSVGDEIDFIFNEISFSYEIISVEKYIHLS